MRIRVLLFGQLKDIFGRQEDTLDLQPGTSLADVMARYAQESPRFGPIAKSIACSVNREYAPYSVVLRDGDEIGLLPPVSGGSDSNQEKGSGPWPGLQSAHCAIVREKIEAQKIADGLRGGEDGATAVFEGVVRNNTRGRATVYLEYESYEPMAINEMEKLAQESLDRFKIRDVRLVHRLGRLEIGETSVAVIVVSAHRGPAFEACRWLIDTLKKTVPIWKKEYFHDGAVWADGEAFPDDIAGITSITSRSTSK